MTLLLNIGFVICCLQTTWCYSLTVDDETFDYIDFNDDLKCNEKGIDCNGSPIDFSIEKSDIADCVRYCNESATTNTDITLATFNPEFQLCKCFATCDEDSSCASCIRSDTACSILECSKTGLCMGTLLVDIAATYKKDCLSSCKSNEDCKWFSFSSERNLCLLFGDCNEFAADAISFVSGQVECVNPPTTKILVTTGDPKSTAVKSEIIDLSSDSSTCADLETFPIQDDHAFGLTNGDSIVCGGIYGSKDSCYKLTDGSFQPVDSLKLNQPRDRSASTSIIAEATSVVSGGNPLGSNASKTLEYLDENGKWQLVNMIKEDKSTFTRRSHCMVAFADKSLMIIGGVTGDDEAHLEVTDTVYKISDGVSWVPQNFGLRTARYDHACAVLTTKGTQSEDTEEVVVVVGGNDKNGKTLSSVEIHPHLTDVEPPFFYQGKPITSDGNELALTLLSMVSMGDRIIAIGGTDGSNPSNKVFELTCANVYDCNWKELSQTLKVARSSFVAIPIEDELVTCS